MKHRKPPIPQPPQVRKATAVKQTGSAILQNNSAEFQAAFNMHQKGLLDQAEALYKQILQSQPEHGDTLLLYATLAGQRQNPLLALELLDRAININPRNATLLNSRGNALLNLGRNELALVSYDRAIAIQPKLSEALCNRGIALLALNRLEPALLSVDRAIKLKPDYALAFYQRGNILMRLNRPKQALASYDRALTLMPDYAAALYSRGMALFELKSTEQALESYERALAIKPDFAEALNNRGNILAILNRPAEALENYDRALEIMPTYAEAAYNRGNALIDMQLPEQALDSYARALTLKPDYTEALYSRGNAFAKLHRHEQALDSYERALALKPDYADALYSRGNALAKLDRHEQALESYERALALKPDFAEALNNCGNIQYILKRYEEALDNYNRALEIMPNYEEALNNRGIVLFELKRLEQALDSYDQALALKPDNAETHNNRGIVLFELKRPEEALDSYDRALALKPDYAEVFYNRGGALMEHDRLTEARDSFRQALKFKPDFLKARYSLAANKADSENLAALAAIEAASVNSATPLSSEDTVLLNFALGKCYHEAREYEKAFPYFLAGCTLKRTELNYDAEQMAQHFTLIKRAFDPATLARLRGKGNPSSLPIFVVGMPRSGTTLTEQIISSHPNVYGAGELTDLMEISRLDYADPSIHQQLVLLSPQQLMAWGDDYITRLQRYAPDAPHITDKLTNNFLAIGLIHLMLPNAKIIHINRNPVDTCLSCLTTWFRDSLPHTYDMTELGRYYVDYQRLMAHWRQVLPSNAFLDIYYEELVADQEAQSRRIIDYCGLEWHDACLDFHNNKRQISTASLVQARRPIYKSSVERWRSYEKFLGPLLDALGEFGETAGTDHTA